MTSPFDGISAITREQVDRLCESSKEGYLVVTRGEDDPLVAHLYHRGRMWKGLTGVCLSPGQGKTLIAANCYGPAGFERLLKTAEKLGVEVVVRCSKAGFLIGWAGHRRAPGVAEKLMALRTSPDRCERRCRHRRQVEDEMDGLTESWSIQDPSGVSP